MSGCLTGGGVEQLMSNQQASTPSQYGDSIPNRYGAIREGVIHIPWTNEDRDIMRDIYLLVSKHPDPANTEEYWQSLIDHAGEICHKYNGHPLAVHFGCAVMEYWQLVCDGSYDLNAKKVINYGIPRQ